MAYIYATSEFTDIEGTGWKVDVVDVNGTVNLNYAFSLGPDGFSLSYDFDEYDRSKPIVGSRVQITLYHPLTDSAAFDTLYNELDSKEEGTFRIEIYRDPDAANELWWVGELIPEQTVIPDDYPNAAVTLTAVDGLANLKGIDYNNDGEAYIGKATVIEHLYNLIQKMHVSDVWSASDIELRFFEDFIGKEYKDFIGGGQNKQLENAEIHHNSFYNKDEEGLKQYFSSYEVLESLAITFNVSVFMAQGSIWWVPLGAIQSHTSSGLDIVNHMMGDGAVIYNTGLNTTISALFGSSSTQYEKLNGWERSSAPSFKQVIRTRDYQGTKSLVHDSSYSAAQIIANDVLSDEDIEYKADQRFQVSGTLVYNAGSWGYITPNIDRAARVKLILTIKFGDAGGTVYYLKRNYDFSGGLIQYDTMWNYYAPPYAFPIVTSLDPTVDVQLILPFGPGVSWETSESTFEILSQPLDKSTGTYDIPEIEFLGAGTTLGARPLSIPFQFVTPELPADAAGLQISASLTGVNWEGVEDTDIGNTSNSYGVIEYRIDHYKITKFSAEQSQEFSSIDITATNPDTARYEFNQGTTLVGDLTSDFDLGTIKINNGTDYVDSTEWTNLQSSTPSLSINGLGVRERLAANEDHKRTERGSLYQTGSTFIHPYTILTNSDHAGNFYQVTGLKFIAARSEYDIECMYLSRNITGITVTQDNSKGDLYNPPPGPLPGTKGPATDNIVSDNSTKLGYVTTDAYGLTGLTTSTGSGTVTLNLQGANAIDLQELYGVVKRLVEDLEDYDGHTKAHAPIGKTNSPLVQIYKQNPDAVTESTESVSLQASTALTSSHTIILPTEPPASGRAVLTYKASGAISSLTDGAANEFLQTNGSGVLSWAAAGGGGGGWHGSGTTIKILPNEFAANDDYSRMTQFIEDDTVNTLGVRCVTSAQELYAFIAIPDGYKVTHVQAYASASTASAVELYQFNHTTGAIQSKGSGNFNAQIDSTDFDSSSTISAVVKLIPVSSVTIIYGASLTIATI